MTEDDPADTKFKESKQKVHTVKLEAGKYVRIDLTSKDFDTYLRLQDEKGKSLAENDDVAPADPTPARPTFRGAQVRIPAKKASMLPRDVAGEPAELFIILPPNLDQAIARGKVMLVFEAKWSGGRCPLSALPKGPPFAFSQQDNAIIEYLETLTDGETPALLQLEPKDFASLLPVLAEHPNITLGKSTEVTVTKAPLKLPLRATLEANGEIVLALKDKTTAFVMVGDWVWHQQTFQPLGLPSAAKDVFRAPVRVPRLQVPQFLSRDWPQLQAAGSAEANFNVGRLHARTASAALSAGTQRRPGATRRAAAMRLWSAHHDRGRDGLR